MEPRSNYGSRKFIVTMTGYFLPGLLLLAGALLEAPDGYWSALAPLFILYAACVAAYNWGNIKAAEMTKANP